MTKVLPVPGSAVRVLIINAVALNGGDGALLTALVCRAREAYGRDAQITVADATPTLSQARYLDLQFVPTVLGEDRVGARLPAGRLARGLRTAWMAIRTCRLLLGVLLLRPFGWSLALHVVGRADRAAVAAYRDADVVISSGGTNLVEHYRLLKRWLSFAYAEAARRPLVLFTQSLGPFRARENRWAMRRFGRYARLVLLRDRRSLGHLYEIGVVGRHLVVDTDAAFGLPAPALPVAQTPPRRFAVSVRYWPHGREVQGVDTTEAYRTGIAAVVAHILKDPLATVTFVSTCQGDETYEDDSVEALRIANLLQPALRDRVVVDREYRHPEDLMQVLGQMDAVIATRMHFAILSLLCERPVLPIAYEFKTQEVFSRLGRPDVVVPLEEVSPQRMVEAYDAFIADLPALQATLIEGVERERAAAQGVAERLRRAVPECAGRP